jgi:hypothetical protein
VATNKLDMPYDQCQVDSVAADGTVTNYSGFNPRQGFAYQPDWKSGRTVNGDKALHDLVMAVRQLADQTGVAYSDGSNMTWGSGEARVLSLAVTLPAQDAERAYKDLLGQVFPALTQLNKQGCEIAMVELSMDDAQGEPVLGDVHDFELGAVGTWYERLLPPWISPPPTGPAGTTTASSLDPAQKQQLDGLNAADVVRWYMTATNPAVVMYLCAPLVQREMAAPNCVAQQRHANDISNLTLDGPADIFTDPGVYSRTEWPIQQHFVAKYDLLIPRDSMEQAGPQIRFVYVGRQSESSPWKILGVGTGP